MRTPIPWSTGRRTGPKAELLRRLGVTTGAWELLRGWGMQLKLARNTSEESIHDSQCCNYRFFPMVFQHIMAVISGFIPRSRRPVWVASPCDSTSWFPKDVAVASGDRMPTACGWCPVVLGAAGVAEIRRVFRDGQFCLTYSHHSSAIFSPLHDDIDKTWDTWGRRSHFSASSPRSWKTIKKAVMLRDFAGWRYWNDGISWGIPRCWFISPIHGMWSRHMWHRCIAFGRPMSHDRKASWESIHRTSGVNINQEPRDRTV